MDKDSFYAQHKECLATGISQREHPKTDVLECLQFGGNCAMMKCIAAHSCANTVDIS